jgi:hypothetical protein
MAGICQVHLSPSENKESITSNRHLHDGYGCAEDAGNTRVGISKEQTVRGSYPGYRKKSLPFSKTADEGA